MPNADVRPKFAVSVVVGAVVNMAVLVLNLLVLRIPPGTVFRPPWQLGFLLMAFALFGLAAGLPLSLRESRSGNPLGVLGTILSLSPLPYGIITFHVICMLHGVRPSE